MKTLQIKGGGKFSGNVILQGAKNATMHEILMSLIANDKFTIKNVPNISSITNQLKIIELLGAKTSFKNHVVTIDNTKVTAPKRIPSDLFFHTSGAVYAVPLLAGRFGSCEVEFDFDRSDTGGDQIGRSFIRTIELYRQCDIETTKTSFGYSFKSTSNEPFQLDTQNRAWGKSQNWLLAALFKHGKSTIKNYAQEPEHKDYISFLRSCGALIEFVDDDVIVTGDQKYHGTSHEAMSDKNDLVTWIFLSIATKTPLTISNVEITPEQIKPIFAVLDNWGVKLEWEKDKLTINLKNLNLKPVNIIAGMYPMFHTDWQPLIAPVLTQIDGVSTIIDSYQSNRMQHWKQLEKMGAKYEFFTDHRYPEENGNPRAVRAFGGTKLHGDQVDALDVRAGAGLAIAAVIADGQTTINNFEQIERGYENFDGRLKGLGAIVNLL